MASVLLIEPDRILAKNCVSALKKAGYKVVWSSSGQAAINAADNSKPDVVLLELQMPSHNGLEFLYELRSYPEWQNVPVVLWTLVPDMALGLDSASSESLGVTGYLYKPQTKLSHIVRAVEQAAQTVLA